MGNSTRKRSSMIYQKFYLLRSCEKMRWVRTVALTCSRHLLRTPPSNQPTNQPNHLRNFCLASFQNYGAIFWPIPSSGSRMKFCIFDRIRNGILNCFHGLMYVFYTVCRHLQFMSRFLCLQSHLESNETVFAITSDPFTSRLEGHKTLKSTFVTFSQTSRFQMILLAFSIDLVQHKHLS